MPRYLLRNYIKAGDDKVLKESKQDPVKFTISSDPRVKQLLEFLIDDSFLCPDFLPMSPNDSVISANVYMAASLNPHIPISEYVRKEFYYHCFNKFITAIAA